MKIMEIGFKQVTIQVGAGRHKSTELSLSEINKTFHFTILDSEKYDSSFFTVMLYDLDAPKGTYLHYLAINHTISEDDNDNTIIGYYPLQKVGHRYVYETYVQKAHMDIRNVRTPTLIPFDLDKYVKTNDLKKYAKLTVKTQDRLPSSEDASLDDDRRSDDDLPPVKYHGFVHDLEGPNAKYCTCIIEAAHKGGKANPYAVCTKSTGGHMSECGSYYDYEHMPLEYLLVFANKHQIHVQNRESRSSAIQAIKEWKMKKGHRA